MKHSKQQDHKIMIEAFRTLFNDQYFHDSCSICTLPGLEDSMLSLEMRTAMGHDGKPVEPKMPGSHSPPVTVASISL